MASSKVHLYAPPSYWRARKKGIINQYVDGGCGPGKFGDKLIPDKILGVDVRPACEIHDWMYMMGESQEDKDKADRVFRNNMVRLIMAHPARPRWLRRLRLWLAHKYYMAVHRYGGPAFWIYKNPSAEYQAIGAVVQGETV